MAGGSTGRYDPAAARTWLTSPSTEPGRTVADTLAIDDGFHLSGFHKWPRINALVAAAQHAHLLGGRWHTLHVLHVAGDDGFAHHHRVTLTLPDQRVLCSPALDTADLFTDHLTGVDAAVHLLTVVAHTADQLHPPRPGRAFPPLGSVPPTPLPPHPIAQLRTFSRHR
jgi:hypothetical protein